MPPLLSESFDFAQDGPIRLGGLIIRVRLGAYSFEVG